MQGVLAESLLGGPAADPLVGREFIPMVAAVLGKDDTCMVCLESLGLEGEEVVVPKLECKHSFHHACLQEWLGRQSTCPVCRAHLAGSIEGLPALGVPLASLVASSRGAPEPEVLRPAAPRAPLSRDLYIKNVKCVHCGTEGHAHFECPNRPAQTRYF